MGLPIIYLILFILLLAATTFISFFYFLHKKSKAGIVISALLVLLFTSILGMNYIDQWTISKKDIVSNFMYLNILLKDDFEIVGNEVIGMPDRIQDTRIEVSQKDKLRIIAEIKRDSNFKSFVNGQRFSGDSPALRQAENNELFNIQYSRFLFPRD